MVRQSRSSSPRPLKYTPSRRTSMNIYLMCVHCGVEITMASFRPAPDLRCPICGAINYPPVQHFKRGDLLAGYSILKRIEANRTSETYLARSFNNRTIINLQTFSSKTIESGITAEYYLGAMKQWMKVRQPNIAKVLDVVALVHFSLPVAPSKESRLKIDSGEEVRWN